MTLWQCESPSCKHFSTEGEPTYCPHCGEATIEKMQGENWSYRKG